MSNLYQISKIETSRQESDIFSYNEKSYNSWQYGDEASLYSIAEDSREDWASEVPSMAGTENASAAPTQSQSVPVDRHWEEEVQQEAEIDSSNSSALSEIYYRLQHSARTRFFVGACLVITIIVAVMIGIAASTEEETPPSENVGEIVASGPESAIRPSPAVTRQTSAPTPLKVTLSPSTITHQAPTPAPTKVKPPTPTKPNKPPAEPQLNHPSKKTAEPTYQPTKQIPSAEPTYSTKYKLADGFVLSALQLCPDIDNLEDVTKPQGAIYKQLVSELYERTTVGVDGFIYYPLDFGVEYLKEKFALEMLYEATNGDKWTVNTYWNTDTDPCSGWYGISTCTERIEGSCGVTHIDLSKCLLFCWTIV